MPIVRSGRVARIEPSQIVLERKGQGTGGGRRDQGAGSREQGDRGAELKEPRTQVNRRPNPLARASFFIDIQHLLHHRMAVLAPPVRIVTFGSGSAQARAVRVAAEDGQLPLGMLAHRLQHHVAHCFASEMRGPFVVGSLALHANKLRAAAANGLPAKRVDIGPTPRRVSREPLPRLRRREPCSTGQRATSSCASQFVDQAIVVHHHHRAFVVAQSRVGPTIVAQSGPNRRPIGSARHSRSGIADLADCGTNRRPPRARRESNHGKNRDCREQNRLAARSPHPFPKAAR